MKTLYTYAILVVAVSSAFLIFAVLLPNTPLLVQFLRDADSPLLKAKIIMALLAGILTNFTFLNRVFVFAIAILFGVYVSLFVFFLKQRKKIIAQTGAKTGFVGLMSGIFGVGCASCGSFLLSIIFSTAGAAGVIARLPFRGVEFAIISVALLSLSLYILAKNIVKNNRCKLEISSTKSS